jgi:hypothetical protein
MPEQQFHNQFSRQAEQPGAQQGTSGKGSPGATAGGKGQQQSAGGQQNFFQPPNSGTDMGQMFAALTNASLTSTAMLHELGGIISQQATRQQANQGYRTLKPKRDITQVTCATAELLMAELIDFEIDLQELGVRQRAEAAFFQLRAVCQGQAKDIFELALVSEPMQSMHQQAHWFPQGDEYTEQGMQGRGYCRTQALQALYTMIIAQLRAAVNLTDQRMEQFADDRSGAARMRGETADDAITFLKEFRQSRLARMRAGLIPHDPSVLQDPRVLQAPPYVQQLLQKQVMQAARNEVMDISCWAQQAGKITKENSRNI